MTITVVQHVFRVIADLLAMTSIVGLPFVLYSLFRGERSDAASDIRRGNRGPEELQ